MKEKYLKLQEEFNKISKKGYIKGISNNYSAIGRTFENELNLSENELSIPDYYGIELKTRRTYSKSYITLFNANPDGDYLFEIERIKNTYGYPYKNDKKYKALYVEAYGNKLNFAGIKYQYKIDIDRKNEKVYLCIFNFNNQLIEKEVSWSFNYLNKVLFTKLKYLAIVNVWTKKIENWNYFKYYKIDFYELTNFEKFIKLIEDGTIKLTIKIDIHTGINNYGKTYNHGCGFCILENDINKLYNKIKI